MSAVSSPQPPPYRITLFYGPEPVAGFLSRVSCVFNVKKRSWKGGVQVAVEMEEEQLARARQAIGFDVWLDRVLSEVPEAERGAYENRARDHLAQAICSLKLDLAVEAGLSQENQTIQADTLVGEVDRAVPIHADQLKASIRVELDIPQNER
ncbi:MAG TPA: hypothetical protein VGQ60_00930 [Nitrospiraceae bacterium]|jgi:hypothetical protein|nr:hypothetical protein [Nitrospiraceae bacterium]